LPINLVHRRPFSSKSSPATIAVIFKRISLSFTQDHSTKLGYISFRWCLEPACVIHQKKRGYNNYGCHCGIGGRGEPLDGIDRCCPDHDQCYDAIIDNKICGSLKSAVYLIFYWRNGYSNCASRRLNTACQKALCECDGTAARCFKRNEFSFHSRSINYNKLLC
ncbi:basic phospholipase A2 Ceg-N6-like, partial [Orbicella faveolata]|uniref:basic phospholipase A2 Ceg-N6-like n=1 Tax=Orbicella faveolata TaxID=48498 RepID=UPI0009E5EFC1